jgi:hypothetical protein
VNVLVLVLLLLGARPGNGLAFALRELRLSLHPASNLADPTLDWRQQLRAVAD